MLNRHMLTGTLLRAACTLFLAQAILILHGGAAFGSSVRALNDPSAERSGDWTVENNECIASGDGVMTIASDGWRDYTLRVRFITDEPGSNPWDTAGIRFRAGDERNYYYAIIHKTGLLEFGKVMRGEKTANLATSATAARVTEWNELRVALKGNLTTISLNGKDLIHYTDPDPLTSGGIALWSLGARRCRFTNISASMGSGDIAWKAGGSKARPTAVRRNAVGVFMGTSPADSALARSVIQSLAGAGFTTISVAPEDACIPGKIAPERFFLYVVPNSRRYPAAGLRGVQDYLRSRGNLMVLGGPAFSVPVHRVAFAGSSAEWYDLDALKKKITDAEGTTNPAAYMKTIDKGGRKWAMLQVGEGDWPASELETVGLKLVPGAGGGMTRNCLAYSADRISGWGTFSHGLPPGLVRANDDSLALWAKGDANTPQILLELDEKDGSRWIFPLNVSTDWKYYEIPFNSFRYWTSVKTRGGAGDSFKGAAGARVSLGLAMGNCRVNPGAHRFWIDGLGFTASSLTRFRKETDVIDPIETVYPAYKVYPVGKITTASLDPRQCIVTPATLPSGALAAPANGVSPIARPKGMGYGGESQCRWIPLVNVYDRNEKRGTVASLTINKSGRYRDTLCASIGVETLDAGMSRILREMAVRMRDGLFLLDAGSEYSCYYPGEPVKLGAHAVNLGEGDRDVTVQMKIFAGTKILWKDEGNLALRSGTSGGFEKRWNAVGTAGQPLVVKTTLLRGGKIVDSIQQELAILPPRGDRSRPRTHS